MYVCITINYQHINITAYMYMYLIGLQHYIYGIVVYYKHTYKESSTIYTDTNLLMPLSLALYTPAAATVPLPLAAAARAAASLLSLLLSIYLLAYICARPERAPKTAPLNINVISSSIGEYTREIEYNVMVCGYVISIRRIKLYAKYMYNIQNRIRRIL